MKLILLSFLMLLSQVTLGQSSVRLPDGLQCRTASDCLSGYCGVSGNGSKVCASPGNFCYGQGDTCGNDCDCCSGICYSDGTCVADGIIECVAPGRLYKSSSRECCSGLGSSNGKCKASESSCLPLREICNSHSECCSNKCGSNGKCQPNSNAIFGGAPVLLKTGGERAPASLRNLNLSSE